MKKHEVFYYLSRKKPNPNVNMGCLRALLCILFPPLAVIDRGCGAILLVFILTLCGWIPGVIAAILFNTRSNG